MTIASYGLVLIVKLALNQAYMAAEQLTLPFSESKNKINLISHTSFPMKTCKATATLVDVP